MSTIDLILVAMAIYLPCGAFVGLVFWWDGRALQRMRQEMWDCRMMEIESRHRVNQPDA